MGASRVDEAADPAGRHSRRIGVVIPAFGAGPFLHEAVESVLGQTQPVEQIVIVDDGSLDDTLEIARELASSHPNIKVLHQTNSGPVAARNRGMDELDPSIDLVLFLDADDILLPKAVEVLAQALTPESPGAYGLPLQFDEGEPLPEPVLETCFGFSRRELVGRRLRTVPLHEPTRFECVVVWIPICTSGQLLLRREAFSAAGAFSPAVPIGEDWDAWLRLAALGPLQFVPEIVLHKREWPSSYSKDGVRLAVAEREIRRRLRRLPLLTPHQRQVALRAERYSFTVRFSWAYDDLIHRRYRTASRNAARGLKRFVGYLLDWRERR